MHIQIIYKTSVTIFGSLFVLSLISTLDKFYKILLFDSMFKFLIEKRVINTNKNNQLISYLSEVMLYSNA